MSDQASTTPAAKNAPGIVKRSTATFVDPRAIDRRPGFNPRFTFLEIQELAATIAAQGVLNPLRVRRNPQDATRWVLVDGDRRLQAIMLLLELGHQFPEGVPAIIVGKDQSEMQDLIQTFVASNHTKPWLAIEEAGAYQRLMAAGMTVAQISHDVGRSVQHIEYTVGLLSAAPEVQQAIADGTISATVGKEIALRVKGDTGKQAEIVAKAIEAGKGAKTPKDKKAVAAVVKAEVREVQQQRAAVKNRVLKIRALDDAQLSELGAKQAALLAPLLRELGMDKDGEALLAAIPLDGKMAAAFTMGTLMALKAAAGQKVNLKV